MKELAIAIAICMFSMQTMAQNENIRTNSVSLQYNDTWMGRNINLTYGYMFLDSWRVYGGLKYHINGNLYRSDITPFKNATPDEHAVFYKLSATTLSEHLGLKVGIEKMLFFSAKADFLLFYDFQYMPGMGVEYGGGGVNPLGQVVLSTPFPANAYNGRHFQEHNIGCGVVVKATKRIGARIQAGLGVTKNSGQSQTFGWNGEDLINSNWKLTRLIGFGIDYSFLSRKQHDKKPFNR